MLVFVVTSAVVFATTIGRNERFDVCLVCGIVRSEVRAWSIPLHRTVDDTPGFTAWVRARKPEHAEHHWVHSHTLQQGELDCSKSPLPYVLSGLYANVGPTPEVEALLDTIDAEVRADAIDADALIARSNAIRRARESGEH